jgi:hypothetical protein
MSPSAASARLFRPDSFARLQSLKSRYEPDNVLHRKQNIRRPITSDFPHLT